MCDNACARARVCLCVTMRVHACVCCTGPLDPHYLFSTITVRIDDHRRLCVESHGEAVRPTSSSANMSIPFYGRSCPAPALNNTACRTQDSALIRGAHRDLRWSSAVKSQVRPTLEILGIDQGCKQGPEVLLCFILNVL